MFNNNKKGYGKVSDGFKFTLVLMVFVMTVVLAVTLISYIKTIFIGLPVATPESTDFLNTYSTNVYNAFDNGFILIILLFFIASVILAMKTYMPSRFVPVSILVGILFCFGSALVQYILLEWLSHTVFVSIMGYIPIINFTVNYLLEICIVYTSLMIILLHTRLGDGG